MKTAANYLLRILILLTSATACNGGAGEAPTSESAQVIYRGNGGEPGSLDPALAEDVHAFNILTDLYEGLVTQSANGRLVPGVAASWTISDDGLTYIFTLRSGARWSNGEPVISADFVNAFRRVADPVTASAYSFLLDSVRRLVSIDDRTLELSLEAPTPHILSLLAMPIAFPVPSSRNAAPSFSDPDTFVGNGPYVLAEHAVGATTRLIRNSTYWDADSVAVDEIVYFAIIDPMTELNMYRAGEIDITNTIPPTSVQSLKASMPDHVRITPSLALYYLAFDLTEPPFDNVLLRQALNMAIDREQLVALIGRGEQPAYGIVPTGVAAHSGTHFEWRDLSDGKRIGQARSIFRNAGYSAESPLKIKYTYDSGDIHEKVALAVSSMWRDVLGVEVTLEKMEWQYFLETRDKRAEWQIMRFAWFGDYNDASTFTNIFRSGDPQNLSHYSNDKYDQRLTDATKESREDRRADLIANAESLLLKDHPIAPLYFFVSKHLVNPQIGGFEDNVLDRHPSKYLNLEGAQQK